MKSLHKSMCVLLIVSATAAAAPAHAAQVSEVFVTAREFTPGAITAGTSITKIYNTPQTLQYIGTVSGQYNVSEKGIASPGRSGYFVASVKVPQGATVTQVYGYYVDEISGGEPIKVELVLEGLLSTNHTVLATTTSAQANTLSPVKFGDVKLSHMMGLAEQLSIQVTGPTFDTDTGKGRFLKGVMVRYQTN